MIKRRWYPIAAIACAVVLACQEDATMPGEPTLAVPGTLVLSLTTPNSDDGAILFSIAGGEMVAPSAASNSHLLFVRATGGTSINAVVLGDLTQGALMTFDVPDVEKASSYSATVSQVADRNNLLRDDISGYGLALSVQ